MPSIGSSVGKGRGRAQRARVWSWVRVRSQMCEFPRPEQACNCSTSPIYTHTDTPQRVRGRWGRGGVTVHGTGFQPASLESGLFLKGTPRRLHCVTFAPTSQFSPYLLHTRQYTDTPQRVRGWWKRRGSQFMGRGFDLRPWSQGCSLRGPPADFTV